MYKISKISDHRHPENVEINYIINFKYDATEQSTINILSNHQRIYKYNIFK